MVTMTLNLAKLEQTLPLEKLNVRSAGWIMFCLATEVFCTADDANILYH